MLTDRFSIVCFTSLAQIAAASVPNQLRPFDPYFSDPEFTRMYSTELSLAEQIEARVLQSTHGRIRNLTVEDVSGHVFVRGQVPSHHTRQLALHGALQLLSGDRFSAMITVG